MRTLVETQVLAGERGAYRLGPGAPEHSGPSHRAGGAGRTHRPLARKPNLLQAAAVIGKDVPIALLQAIAEVPWADAAAVWRIAGSGVLYETTLFPELAYTFKHALTQEVAYNALLLERREACMNAWHRPSRALCRAPGGALQRAGASLQSQR